MGRRHYVHLNTRRLAVSCGRAGFVFAAHCRRVQARLRWSMQASLDRSIVLNALGAALRQRGSGSTGSAEGILHHSDRGSQYASADFQQALAEKGMACSMSHKGNPSESGFRCAGTMRPSRVSLGRSNRSWCIVIILRHGRQRVRRYSTTSRSGTIASGGIPAWDMSALPSLRRKPSERQFHSRYLLNQLSTKSGKGQSSHTAALASIAQTVFPGVSNKDLGYRRQVGINLNPGRLYLDYVLHVAPSAAYTSGPGRVILEVQGGGETSNTGTITRYVEDWINHGTPKNAFLAQPLNTKNLRAHLGITKVNVPGIIPNNAWKRQLDQILKKAVIANHFSGAFALVCGDVLYDYIRRSIPVGGAFFPGWQVALIGVSEVPAVSPVTPGSPLAITNVTKAVFMTFADFLAALQGFQVSTSIPDPFNGNFDTLTNQKFTVP